MAFLQSTAATRRSGAEMPAHKVGGRCYERERVLDVYRGRVEEGTDTLGVDMWNLYIVRCRRGELYTGITNNLDQRLIDHNRGKGCKYTAHRRPVTLVYAEPHPDRSSAQKREKQIKGWSRAKKETLIRNA